MVDETMFCPKCHALSSRRIEQRRETLVVRGDAIEVDAEVAVCPQCGEEIGDIDLSDAILERAYSEYRRRHGILAPEQIRVVRESTGLTQRGFARLLGWGDVQVHRYETGALPDDAHNTLLVALQDPETMYRFVQQRLDHVSPLDRRKIEAAMTGRLTAWGTASVRRGLQQLIEAYPLSARGNRPFDLERIGHMIVFFASGVQLGMVKLNKMLWCADFLSFKRSSVALAGLPYVRLPYGPVPDRYKLLLSEIEDEGFVHSRVDVYPSGYEGMEYEPIIPFDASLFTADEIAVLRTVKDRIAPLNGSQAAAWSHQQRAWLETPPNEVVSYSFAKDLHLD